MACIMQAIGYLFTLATTVWPAARLKINLAIGVKPLVTGRDRREIFRACIAGDIKTVGVALGCAADWE
jgi:hypothetical protein